MRPVTVEGRRIGVDAPAWIIAEAGVNHNGDPALARKLVAAAAEAGADAVKFQTFRSAALVTAAAPKAAYQTRATTAGESQRAMLAALELDMPTHAELREHARKHGLTFFSSPFDEPSADALAALGVNAFKVPSGEIVNISYLRHLARFGKPLVISTGMATLDEVAVALDEVRASGDPPVVLLHCLSAYPAPVAEVNLRAMDTLRERFACPVGLSDHTLGISVALAAVARGATVLEKHLTLDKHLPGPDHAASLDPVEFAALVKGVREIEAALGDGVKRPMPSELDTRRVARKSIVAARPLAAGERLTPDALTLKRPGTGIPPAELPELIGRRVLRAVAADELLDRSWIGQ